MNLIQITFHSFQFFHLDNNCAWLFHDESILLYFPEDNDTCIDLSAAIERSNALDVLYKLKQ